MTEEKKEKKEEKEETKKEESKKEEKKQKKEKKNEEESQVRTEEFKVNGAEVIDKIKELIHEGNIRRIILKNSDGGTIIEVPLTLGLVGAALMAPLAAIGAIAALMANLTIVVEKVGEKKD